MAINLKGQWRQYYPVPLLRPEIESGLSRAAFRYFAFLYRQANVRNVVELQLSVSDIKAATGIRDHKTQKEAREELERARLIECRRGPLGVWTHTLLNQYGNPIPPPNDRTGVLRHVPHERAKSAKRVGAVVPAGSSSASPAGTNLDCPILTGEWCRFDSRESCDLRGWEESMCDRCPKNPHGGSSFTAPTAKEIGFS
jgi:hypothetical protein